MTTELENERFQKAMKCAGEEFLEVSSDMGFRVQVLGFRVARCGSRVEDLSLGFQDREHRLHAS